MKIETTIMYDRPYLPKGCRKYRYEEDVKETIVSNIREVSKSDLQLAMRAEGFHFYGTHRVVPLYAYKGKLYREAEIQPSIEKEERMNALQWLIHTHKHYSTYYAKTKRFDLPTKFYLAPDNHESRTDILKRLRRDLSRLLIVDGVLYEQSVVPMYRLVTFGWGGCGTCLHLVRYRYPQKAVVGMRGWYWSALDHEAAIAKANEVVARRGDTQDVGKFHKLVEVYMPEFVKRVYL